MSNFMLHSTTDLTSSDMGGVTSLPPLLSYLNRGSFGKVYRISRQDTVLKVVLDSEWQEQLMIEYNIYHSVQKALGTPSSPASFQCPRALYYRNPLSPPSTIINDIYPIAPFPSFDQFDGLGAAYIGLDLIPPLPRLISSTYRKLFWRPPISESDLAIRLLRLYLGRSFPPTTSEAGAGLQTDPPLDLSRFILLREAVKTESGGEVILPSLEDISFEMGRSLGKVIWECGQDSGDSEWVLGGSRTGNGVQCYLLDFNQGKSWITENPLKRVAGGESIETLLRGSKYSKSSNIVDAAGRIGTFLGTYELYYPRLTISTHLYEEFQRGYISSVEEMIEREAPAPITGLWIEGVEVVRKACEEFFVRFEGRKAVGERKAPSGMLFRRTKLEDL